MQFLSRRDLDFLLYEWLGVEALSQRSRYAEHGRDTFDAIIDLSARLAEERFLTHYKKSDAEEPFLENGEVHVIPEIREAVAAYAEAGLLAAPFDAALGGQQLPHVIHTASMAHFMAANIATAAYPMLTAANARLIAAFGSPSQIAAFVLSQLDGRALGTMCLSEPQAGSSLADITTRAVPDGEDALGQRYRLVGNKMWISGGDHDLSANIVHLVLAKVPGADARLVPGSKGISLFIVPKFLPEGSDDPGARNDVTVAGLNHKMGYRGTTNCLLNLGEGVAHRPMGRGGAVGWLVGERGAGLALMFRMMNEARISVGLGAAMLGYRGYLAALAYARARPQGRPLGASDPARPPVPIVQHPDVKRMLLAQKAYAEGALALLLYCARLVDDELTATTEAERDRVAALLGLLTPVAKTWPSEWGLAANDLAIQVHGGYGYTRDFDVEQLYRDNRLNPIHEGTSGIQALDLVGRKIVRDGGRALAVLSEEVARTIVAGASRQSLSGFARRLDDAWGRIRRVAEQLILLDGEPQALWNATPYLSAFGHAVLGWIWLEQATRAVAALEAGDKDRPFYEGKLRACRYFFEGEMPKIGCWLDVVGSLSDVAAGMPDESF
jgi:alkylation response protein AidB-like acyl-CoA dehydrogenase